MAVIKNSNGKPSKGGKKSGKIKPNGDSKKPKK